MTMVRFATTCDATDCDVRSAEYTAWPSCRTCGADTCPAHMAPGSLHETDGESPATCECRACAALDDDEGEVCE